MSKKPLLLNNVRIIDPSRNLDEVGAILTGADGRILAAGRDALNQGAPEGAEIRNCAGLVAAPGLVDAQVFVGEPARNTAKRSRLPAVPPPRRGDLLHHDAGNRSCHR